MLKAGLWANIKKMSIERLRRPRSGAIIYLSQKHSVCAAGNGSANLTCFLPPGGVCYTCATRLVSPTGGARWARINLRGGCPVWIAPGEAAPPRPAIVAPIVLSRDVPPIAQKKSFFGPGATRLMHRMVTIWLALCVVGALPTLLSALSVIELSPATQALGWGLWLPGAGFVAVGGWPMLLFPFTLLLFFAAVWVRVLSGALVLPFAIWIGAAVIAYFMTGEAIFTYTFVIVPGRCGRPLPLLLPPAQPGLPGLGQGRQGTHGLRSA